MIAVFNSDRVHLVCRVLRHRDAFFRLRLMFAGGILDRQVEMFRGQNHNDRLFHPRLAIN